MVYLLALRLARLHRIGEIRSRSHFPGNATSRKRAGFLISLDFIRNRRIVLIQSTRLVPSDLSLPPGSAKLGTAVSNSIK